MEDNYLNLEGTSVVANLVVVVDIGFHFPKIVGLIVVDDKGKESMVRVAVDYPNVAPHCCHCVSFGHFDANCGKIHPRFSLSTSNTILDDCRSMPPLPPPPSVKEDEFAHLSTYKVIGRKKQQFVQSESPLLVSSQDSRTKHPQSSSS